MKELTLEHIERLQAVLGYRPAGFQFYPNDWLGSPTIAGMKLEQEGAYIRLLAYCWSSDRLALIANPAKLAALSKLGDLWPDLGEEVLDQFSVHPVDGNDWLTHHKLIDIRYVSLQRSIAGKAGAASPARQRPRGQQTASNRPAKPQQPPSK